MRRKGLVLPVSRGSVGSDESRVVAKNYLFLLYHIIYIACGLDSVRTLIAWLR